MRERLIELIKKMPNEMYGEEFADYLLANGVIAPPCKVGTTLFMIVEKRAKVTREYFKFIKKTKLTFLNLERVLKAYGKTVFLTKEGAEQALSKLRASYGQVRKEDEGK